MEHRTLLKENRNANLVIAWFIISFAVFIGTVVKYGRGDEVLVITLGLQICFVLYRVLTYSFNSLILFLFPAKKFKINRLKSKISPIYKIEESDIDWSYKVKKYSVYYTKLDLQWSVPFSVLFKEQEYLYDGTYIFKSIPKDIAVAWEAEENKKVAERSVEIAKKDKKQQKLDNLNKVFKQNYE